ncbi:MAG: hypothetical protein ACRDVW_04100 [Acidimicrobiales bacterium]
MTTTATPRHRARTEVPLAVRPRLHVRARHEALHLVASEHPSDSGR